MMFSIAFMLGTREMQELSLAAVRFFWPGMSEDVQMYVKNCQRCVFGKIPEPDAHATLENIQTQNLWNYYVLTFGVLNRIQGMSDVLVVTVNFSKMAYAFPLSNPNKFSAASGMTSSACMVSLRESIPNFESKFIKNLFEMAGIQKSHITPYHPMGNGIVECFNRTLGNMIRALPV